MIRINIQDNGLQVQRPATSRLQAKVGVCSAGTLNQVVRLRDPALINSSFGTGPLANACGDYFAAGGQEVLVVRANGDVPGANSAVTAAKTGQGNMTVAGAPLDAYQVVIEILSAGTLNVATFRYSLDGGDTWSTKITVPSGGAYVLNGTGLTLTFTVGAQPDQSFLVGDKYSFTTTAPSASVASLTAALDALLVTAYEFDVVHVAGPTAAATWTTLAARAAAAANAGRYFHFVVETRGPNAGETTTAWVTAVTAEVVALSDTRMTVVAGRAEIADYLNGRQVERNVAGIYTGRLAAIPEHTSPAAVGLGPVPMVVRLAPADITDTHLANLDAARLITFKTILGLSGLYVCEGYIRAAENSDYQTVELRRIMDKACRLVRREASRYDHAEGTAEGIAALEAQLTSPLENEMAGQIVAGRVVIPEQNLGASNKLTARIRITPVPVMREIEIDIGFEN